MAMIRPGGEALTKKAIGLARLEEGARVLDIGCGEGDTAALLAEGFGLDAAGIDASHKMVARGKERHPGIDLRRMEAEFLDFGSRSFDAVLMECSLSVLRLKEDALFEAYCVLKPGGKLIITDLYNKAPDPAKVAAMLAAANAKARQPKEEGACGENESPTFLMLDGALLLSELTGTLEDMGFAIEHFSDEPGALAGFAAQAVMGHGSLGAYFKAVVPEGEDASAYCACAAFCGGDGSDADTGGDAAGGGDGSDADIGGDAAGGGEGLDASAAGGADPDVCGPACKPPKGLGYFLMVARKE